MRLNYSWKKLSLAAIGSYLSPLMLSWVIGPVFFSICRVLNCYKSTGSPAVDIGGGLGEAILIGGIFFLVVSLFLIIATSRIIKVNWGKAVVLCLLAFIMTSSLNRFTSSWLFTGHPYRPKDTMMGYGLIFIFALIFALLLNLGAWLLTRNRVPGLVQVSKKSFQPEKP